MAAFWLRPVLGPLEVRGAWLWAGAVTCESRPGGWGGSAATAEREMLNRGGLGLTLWGMKKLVAC